MKYSNRQTGKKTTIFPSVTLLLLSVFFVPALSSGKVSVEVQENINTLIKTNGCAQCNLANADLNRLDLSGSDLRNADLSGATFFLADLSGANLSGAILRGAQFGGTDMAQADMREADLRGANLTGAYTVGSLMDGTLVDKEMIDEDAEAGLHEKVFIPDDEQSKELPEKQEVTISKRRDFDAVPPVIDSTKLIESDPVQGPSSLTREQEAPPVKIVAPVRHITISEQEVESPPQVIPVAVEQGAMEEDKAAVDGRSTPVEFVAGGSVKTRIEPEYQELEDTKKTDMNPVPPTSEEPVELFVASKEADNKEGAVPGESDFAESKQENELLAEQTDTAMVLEPAEGNVAVQETVMVSDNTETKKKETTPTAPKQESFGPVMPSNEKHAAETKKEQDDPGQEIEAAASSSTLPTAQEPSRPVTPEVQESDLVPVTAMSDKAEVTENSIDAPEGAPTELSLLKLLDANKCYECNLTGVDLSGKNLDEADLEGSNLSGALLEGVDFSEANLKGVLFLKANLKNADFREADLYKADFSGADLTGADFGGAQLDETNFSGAIGYNTEVMAE